MGKSIAPETAVLPAKYEPQVAELRANIAKAIAESKEITVVMTDLDFNTASHYVANFKKLIKTGEDVRTSLVKPLNDEVSVINASLKDLMKEVNTENDRVSKLITDSLKKKREAEELAAAKAKKEAEDKAIAEAIEKEDLMKQQAIANGEDPACIVIDVAIVPEVITKQPKLTEMNTSGLGTMEIPTYEIEDESLIPDEYWIRTLDKAKIAAVRKAAGAKCKVSTIPGVKFTSSISLTGRG